MPAVEFPLLGESQAQTTTAGLASEVLL